TPPFLLVLVPSAPSHAARRQAVRDTWGGEGSQGGLPTRTIFVLGLPGVPGEQAALGVEARRHGDLL
ncbi:B3GN6 acetylglucosaminyltransferase, partial [Nycticryphes semicollaris]|nr:B3GN6 acetylglucosaminyltransferase [Nycticryphes semicollaris]